MSALPEGFPEPRPLTEAEFATIGKVLLIWGWHEQDVGTIAAVGLKSDADQSKALIDPLGYSKKVDLARWVLMDTRRAELIKIAKELDFVRRVFRPERDTLAHGSLGTWGDEAWVRSTSKDRFVIFSDLADLHERANYARFVSLEGAYKLQNFDSGRPFPKRPATPTGKIPVGWA